MPVTEKELFITKENAQKIAIKIYSPTIIEGKSPVVIFAHGFNGNYRELMHHGEGIAEAGVTCVFFDFCGGGEDTLSDGDIKDMTVLTELDDMKDVIGFVRNIDYVDPENLFLMGESMGGLIAAYAASEMKDSIRGLILWYPAFQIPEDALIRHNEGNNECYGVMLNPSFNTVAKDIDVNHIIRGYKAVLIIHGDEDLIVPIGLSRKAAEEYRNAGLTVIKGGGHGFDGEDSRTARELSISFILRSLMIR